VSEMDNIQKIIASTEINHGGVLAVDPRVQKIIKVIEYLILKIKCAQYLLHNISIIINEKDIELLDFQLKNALQQANEIAGEI
jgi:hypothetical protein